MKGLTTQDFDLLAGFVPTRRFDEIDFAEQQGARDLRDRMGEWAKFVISKVEIRVPLRPFVSILNPNGRTSSDYWGCAFPISSMAINKSFAFQLAFIVGREKLEIGFARGSGSTQVQDAAKLALARQQLLSACDRLREVRNDGWVLDLAERAVQAGFGFRRSWRAEDEPSIPNIRSWIDAATSPGGNAATCSMFLSRESAISLGDGLPARIADLLGIVAPLMDAAYMTPSKQEIPGDEDEIERPDKLGKLADFTDSKLVLDAAVIPGLLAAVDSGHHVLLIGPPGTGKTDLARALAKEAERCGYTKGYVITTASADWTTFDTIGGYMPVPENPSVLRFETGVVLDAVSRDCWIIIDEVNRADADKAFGAFLTVLAGFDATLNFHDPAGRPISIQNQTGLDSRFDSESSAYLVGQNWRIIATMNTRDKNALYTLSYAFMRRFNFVHVGNPPREELDLILSNRVSSEEARTATLTIVDTVSVPLGPAIVINMAELIAAHPSVALGVRNAVIAYVIPQMEGRDPDVTQADLKRVARTLGTDSATLDAWFDVAGGALGLKPPPTPSPTADETDGDYDPNQ